MNDLTIYNGPIHRTLVSPAKAGIMCRPITIWLAFGGIPWLRLVQINGHSDLVFVFLYLKTRYYMLFRYKTWQQSHHAFNFDIWNLFNSLTWDLISKTVSNYATKLASQLNLEGRHLFHSEHIFMQRSSIGNNSVW
jgi:hypothetical protein